MLGVEVVSLSDFQEGGNKYQGERGWQYGEKNNQKQKEKKGLQSQTQGYLNKYSNVMYNVQANHI